MLMNLIFVSAMAHNIPPEILYGVLKVESGLGVHTIQRQPNSNGTSDHGIAQINDVAIKEYGLQKHRLIKSDKYAIASAALILADLKKRFPNTWICRYHLGTAKLSEKRLKKCSNYKNKVVTFSKEYFR